MLLCFCRSSPLLQVFCFLAPPPAPPPAP
eukprot:SAG11_NODE_2196_length_3699_cov_2.962222_6_plen_28_part_01